MTIDYDKAFMEIKLNGFFSEYLPPCFNLKEGMFFDTKISDKCDLIEPISFSMSRFDNNNNSRRTIFVPEVGAYSVLCDYFEDQKLLREINEFIEMHSKSFSKIIMDDNTIMKHEQSYGISTVSPKKNKSSYIDNIVSKIILSAGSKKVLKLDISNCFSSIYTHYIPSIILGYDVALHCYNNDPNNNTYVVYKKLDERVRRLNKNQSNGLLVGPVFSKIIAEGLLSRIDIELTEKGLLFTRYVDDYEVYLDNQNEDDVLSIFSAVLKKYGLHLNYAKTEVVGFPFYVVENFDKIINAYNKFAINDYDFMELFNQFYRMEKSGTKGAIRFLAKSIDSGVIKYKDNDLFNSYILNIMSNDPRSLVNTCSILIKNKDDIANKDIDKIKKILLINNEKDFDLEVIWLLYLLIETGNISVDEKIIEKILKTDNELAITMILCGGLTTKIDKIKDKANSWILNYELYVRGELDDDEFKNKLNLNKNFRFYSQIKKRALHFCDL